MKFNRTVHLNPRISLLLILVLVGLFAASCGGAKNKVANKEDARPGRDKELYEEATKKLKKGRYDEARLLFNVVITTYPDSEWLPMSKLAIADSFYREGGSTQLEQAIGGYKDFAQYFPTHPLACEVKLKIAEAYMRQMNAYNRDWTKSQQAEFQLKATLQSCQTSSLKPEIQQRLKEVQQIEGLHELDIANYYFNMRKAYKAAESRLRDVVEKYPFFTYRDEALFRLGQSLLEQEQPEEAAQHFTTLVRDIPKSEYTAKAKEYLEKLGKPIPTPSNDSPAPEHYGKVEWFGKIIGRNGLTTRKDGVLFKDDEEAEEQAASKLQKPGEALGSREINSSKASSVLVPNSPTGSATTGLPAATNATSSPDGANNQADSTTRSRTVNDSAAVTPGTDDKKKNDKKKEKKGLFGRIFK
jgi:outer membrane protein assembly factor BamD